MNVLSLITGEGLLSLYPVLTRTVKTDIITQTVVRLVTTLVICYPFITVPVGTIVTQWSTHLVSLLYIFHIITSYIAFLNLDVGVALTIFYTYPIINVLLHQLLNSSLDLSVISYFSLAFLGSYMIQPLKKKVWSTLRREHEIARDGQDDQDGHLPVVQPTDKSVSRGLVAIILATLSESLIYLFFKENISIVQSNPFNMLFIMCFTGGLLMLGKQLLHWGNPQVSQPSLLTQHTVSIPPDTDIKHKSKPIIQLIIGTIIIGIIGYLLRFYSLPRLSVEVYSILAFSGIIFGYLYGWFFYGETITINQLLGTLLIMYSIYKVKMVGTNEVN